ncbi:nucleotide-diphospho-sugar transferase [Dyadobacter jejuensis]|uniref:Nucleotide-diphospho-sugar transferase n=1 Tax=Dyadobacter jejuensis TaxID=1082580 RepID=A0A316ABV3_9BACT|nr:putative nucleotide-diphospho-sugar transferase [Dyadobacter jejuensis]PWJ55062.1 nucleotide-diphospho-sugar transferase [Dyadobacter jejuensis]
MKKVALITLTNEGYLKYTLNCLLSLKKIGVNDIKTYSIGKKAFHAIRDAGYQATIIEDELSAGFQRFRSGNWSHVTFKKFEIIHENLKENDYVCFTDGDIVFKKKEFLDYCIDHIGYDDLLIQNDAQEDISNDNLCSGFIFIKSNEKTLDFFNPKKVKERSNINERWDDQIYVNQYKDEIAYKKLPLSLFPNGKYFYTNHSNIEPYLIHFNWVIGHEKSWKILKHKEASSIPIAIHMLKTILLIKCKNAVKRILH